MWTPAARPTHQPLGVDRGGVEVEQLIGSIKENQLRIQNLESGMRGLKSDLEEEVLNNEKLNTALAVSKSLVVASILNILKLWNRSLRVLRHLLSMTKLPKALKKPKMRLSGSQRSRKSP